MTDTTQATETSPAATEPDAEAAAAAGTADASPPPATVADDRERVAPRPAAAAAPPSPRPDATTPSNADAALFDAQSTRDLQGRWQTIQVAFVDEPKGAVQQADQLVAEVLTNLQASFTRERQELERAWSGGSEASTEDLRQAIRRYRSFFNRLLNI